MSANIKQCYFYLLAIVSFIGINYASAQTFPSEGIEIVDIPLEIGDNISNILTADLDNDGDKEILIQKASELLIYYQIDQEAFELKMLPSSFGNEINTSCLADMNGDGFKDILTSSFTGGSSRHLFIGLNNGMGSFTNTTEVLVPGITHFYDIKVSDINNDGFQDIFMASLFDNAVVLLLGNGLLSFNSPIFLYQEILNDPGKGPIRIDLVDLNSDNKIDIVVRDEDHSYSWIKNNGNGDFDSLSDLGISTFDNFKFVDFNSDGLIDMYDPQLSGYYPNLDDTNFSQTSFVPLFMPYDFIDMGRTCPGDFDLDGDIDLIWSSHISWFQNILYLNDGNNNFSPAEFLQPELYTNISTVDDIDGNGSLDFILVGDYDDGLDQQYLIWHPNLIGFSESIYGCSFFDENNNGQKEESEKPISILMIKISTTENYYTANDDGCFSYFVEDGTYEITYQPDQKWILSSDSSSYTVNVNGNSFQDLDFGFIPRDTFLAGLMHATSGITRCNTDVRFDFSFQNQGTTIITEGTIFIFQDSLTTLASTEFPIDTMLDERIFGFKFENLYPGETITRRIDLSVPGLGGDIGPGTLIEIFSATEAKNTQGFVNFFKHNYSEEIRCAYDPNDKLISPLRPEDENYTLFGDTLVYTVRFQNTGNDTAFNVVIRDTLDQNLDVGTFNIIHSSHRSELSTDIQDGRNVTFNFENILLPDSTIDFVGSQGYVTYSIQANDPVPEFTPIENTASIYFDFNPPIVTNTTLNTMVSCYPIEEQIIMETLGEGEVYELPDGNIVDQAGVYNVVLEDEEGCPSEIFVVTLDFVSSTSSLVLQNTISVAPNPSTGVFILDLDIDGVLNYRAVISDPFGRDIKTIKIRDKQTLVTTNSLISGVYYLRVLDESGQLVGVKKFIVGSGF